MTKISQSAPEYNAPDDWRGSSPFVQIVRRTIEFLQGLHAQCPPGSYRWCPGELTNPDENESEIWIGADNPVSSDLIGKRPAITVLRGAASFQGVGIGDRAFYDAKTGGMVKMDILPVTLMINVLSRFPLEAEQLAWFEMQHIWALREELMRNQSGIMYTGQRPSISPPTPAGSLIAPDTEHNWTVVSVSFPTYLQHSTTTIPTGRPILREMQVSGLTPSPPTSRAQGVEVVQGTALSQPIASVPTISPDPSAVPTSPTGKPLAALPQTGPNEGESTEPSGVQIVITKE